MLSKTWQIILNTLAFPLWFPIWWCLHKPEKVVLCDCGEPWKEENYVCSHGFTDSDDCPDCRH